MPLKLETDSIEEIESDEIKALYKQEGEKFVLEVEGLPDTKGLKTALEKERGQVKTLKKDLAAFKDFDTEKYKDLLNREAELMQHDPAKVEEMINSRVEQNNKAWQGKYEELSQTLDSKDRRLSDLLVTEELRKVGGELGVANEEAMSDFVSRGKAIFRLDGDAVVPKNGDEVVYGESGVEPLTMREFGKKLSETATHLFKSSAGGGATGGGDGKAGSGTVRYKSDLRTDADKARYIGKHGREAYLKLPDRQAQAS